MSSLSFLNPFHGLSESQHSPHSRTLRTNLLWKFYDAFFVFSGNSEQFSLYEDLQKYGTRFARGPEPEHIGIVDYLTLGIMILPAVAFFKCLDDAKNGNIWAYGLTIPLAIINIPLLAFRYTLSLGLTIATSLIHVVDSGISTINPIYSKKILNYWRINERGSRQ